MSCQRLASAPARPSGTAARSRPWVPIAAFGVALLLQLTLAFAGPPNIGAAILLAGVGTALVLAGLAHPVVAVSLLLIAAFLRLALPISALPVEPFVLAFGGVISSAALTILRRVNQLPRLGAVETAMVLYLVWNIGSAIAPHTLPATVPLTAEEFPVWRFILTGTMIPFTLYYIGRFVLTTDLAVRRVLWLVLSLAGYSAWVSIMQFHGPAALVWPRYIVEAPIWEHRAVGVFNQPVVNGLLLIIGFVVALHLASRSAGSRWPTLVAYAVAASSAYATYLTHTRAIWLSFLGILIAGAVLARGGRPGFIVPLVAATLAMAANWSTFTSNDRTAGGVASTGEIEDRLNSIATSVWAIQEKPIVGWGIGRFTQLNTYYHQQWSPEVSWERGYGISSHLNELGIATELGIVGLALWLTVLVLVGRRLVQAVRLLPEHTAASGMALVTLFAFAVLVTTGVTVDLRFFELPNALVMLLAGVATGSAERLPHTTPVNWANRGPGGVGGITTLEVTR
jgi:O-antigen ligase